MGFAIAEEVYALWLRQAPDYSRTTRDSSLHFLAPVFTIKGGVEVVSIILPLQLAQLIELVRELASLAEQKMRVALRIDNDRVIFVECIGRPFTIHIWLAEAEVINLHPLNPITRIIQPNG
ncbi:hypothetical protein D9M70_558470 [compost metagenome]